MRHMTYVWSCFIVLAITFGMLVSSAIAQEEPYMLFAQVEDSMTLYAYADNTIISIYDSEDNWVSDLELNATGSQTISLAPGTYKLVGASGKPTFGIAPAGFLAEEKVPAEAEAMVTAAAEAEAPLQVICVPWQGSPYLSHVTYEGRSITLQGIAKGLKPEYTYYYEWDFDDGNFTVPLPVSNAYIIEATHAYTGIAVDTPLNPTLTVYGDDGSVASDKFPLVIKGPTLDVKVKIAISEGLWYLHKRMYRWTANYGAGSVDYGAIPLPGSVSDTWEWELAYHSQAMEAFQNQGHLVIGDPNEDPYVETVQRGLNWILRSTAWFYDVSNKQYAGYAEDYNNDGMLNDGGNGIGLSASHQYMYASGIVLLALASSRAPDQIAAPVNRPYVDGRTYADIVQDMVDFQVWAQNDYETWRRGGWRYGANSYDSDNSASQWPVLGIFAAEKPPFNAKVPQWVKDETRDYWIPYSQNPVSGGFGYTTPDWGNVARTGAGLIELAWVGIPITDPYKGVPARDFIADNWERMYGDGNDNKGNYYAMYAVMKGARLTSTDPTTDSGQIEKFGEVDWYKDYATWLVAEQQADGSWPAVPWWFVYVTEIDTPWAILILTPTVFLNPPTAVLEAEPVSGEVGTVITFDASKSYVNPEAPEGTTIATYIFDFGDGTTYVETEGNAPDGTFDGKTTHSYEKYDYQAGYPDGYPVTLKVIDSQDPPQESAPVTILVEIVPPDHPPTAVIKVIWGGWDSDKPGIDFEVFNGVPIGLDASSSYDIDHLEYLDEYGDPIPDPIVDYDWDLTGSPWDYGDVQDSTTATWVWTLPEGKNSETYEFALRVKDTGYVYWDPTGPLYGIKFAKILVIDPNCADGAMLEMYPETYNKAKSPKWLTGHIVPPEGYEAADIVGAVITWIYNEPCTIVGRMELPEPILADPKDPESIVGYRAVAKFDSAAAAELMPDPEEGSAGEGKPGRVEDVMICVIAELSDGRISCEVCDTIDVISK